MSLKKDYIEYVRNVLGIKMIYATQPEETALLQIPLAIYVQDFLNYTTEEKDLLKKMLLAIKMSEKNFVVFDLSESKKVISQMTIYLSDEVNSHQQLAANEVHTYSPRILLKKTALKKAAWDELQKVLHYFQQNPLN